MPTGIVNDVVFAARLFKHQPGIVAMTVVGLAVAIGVSTAVLTLVNAVAFRDSGIANPDSVFHLESGTRGEVPWSYPDYLQLQRMALSVSVMASSWGPGGGEFRDRTDLDKGNLPSVSVMPVSGNYFPVLGARAALGRLLTEADDTPGAPRVLVLAHAFWQGQLGGDASIVGRTVWIGDRPFTVVGVTERVFDAPNGGGTPLSAWMTLAAHFEAAREGKDALIKASRAEIEILKGKPQLDLAQLGRLKLLQAAVSTPRPMVDQNRVLVRTAPGVERIQAEAELTTVAVALAAGRVRTSPEDPPVVRLSPVGDMSSSDKWVVALVTTPAVLLVMLACANVTNLLLASAAGRSREIGTRLALGASRGRVARQLLTESVVLGCLGGAAGLLMAVWLAPWLAVVLRLPPAIDVSPGLAVYLLAAAATIVVAMMAGLAPVRHSQRGDMSSALKSDQLGAPVAVGESRLRSWLVGGQAAASIVLLVLAALLTRSVVVAAGYDHGADIDRLLHVSLRFDRGDDQERRRTFMEAAVERARRLPGVAAVARADFPPFFRGGAFGRVAHPTPTLNLVFRNSTSAEYFDTIGAKVLRGRTYSEEEVKAAAPVAVITASLARELWGTDDPIGSSLERLWGAEDPVGARPSEWSRKPAGTRIIGVVEETTVGLRNLGLPTIYLPIPADSALRLVVRADTTQDPGAIAATLHDALRALDPHVSRTVERAWALYQRELEIPRSLALLGATVALSALALTVVGLFGVTAFVVVQRRHEVSVRLALGASGPQLVRMLLRDSLKPVVTGLACGLVLSFLADRLIRGMLIGISPHDPLAMGSAVAILLIVAVAAAFTPARHAAHVDPAEMLKQS